MHRKKSVLIGLGIILLVLAVAVLAEKKNRYMIYPSTAQYSADDSYGLGGDAGFVEEMEMAAMADTATFGIGANKATRVSAPIPSPEPPIDQDGSVAADVDPADRLIIKNGSLGVVVEDVREAAKAVQAFAEGNGGFVVSSNIYERGRAPSATVLIRIPSASFEQAVSSVQGLGTVEHESISGRDVTEEFVDLEAQLGNYKATEAQFLSIMTRATEIEDILAVQRELSRVRNDIERTEGRMKYLRESAAFSSLTVNLSTDPEDLPIVDDEDKWKPIAVIKDAVRDLIDVAQGVANLFIRVVIFSPVWLVALLVGWLIKKQIDRRNNTM